MELSVYFFSANDRYDFGERYRFILDVARFIDARGFAAIWTPERHFQEFGGSFPNPAVLSAALAVATENIDIRAGSVVLPHHHPVRVVEEWSLVDQLSGGRAGVCVATGWHQGDFVFYPDGYETRREDTLGHIDTLKRLWRGNSVAFPGPGGRELEVRTFPRPRQPELPLWLVHTSNPRTWLEAGRRGLNILTLLTSWEKLEENVTAYRAARAEAGHDPAAGVVTVGMHTYVGSGDEDVWELVRRPVKQYLSSFMSQQRQDDKVSGTSRGTDTAEQDKLAELMAEDYYSRRSLLGSVDKCAATVDRLGAAGVDEVACLVDFGLPFPTVLDALPALDELRRRCSARTAHEVRPTVPGLGPRAASGRRDVSWYYDRG
ncbi:LLM class flavin-dependent oxidoreductase (plasmid) [Streptomyces anulatus]|uniref:MupA/Atu3671 family FMN-dependent luciferase-like monooxygenase n=1 Tax=Streptomyces anulatus TaxID=1892 RepID=UPI00167B7FF8|nr:MupA/Atu3671 family FMN-dependent luciferase-like monooxygenase [Streptomyces anulatus]WSC66779.1 LLM class flavin-dependent oxidoreductase [Streptomyces anulatus]GGY73432.1 siderophore biosynthesis protein [Streptomyces anulatus]